MNTGGLTPSTKGLLSTMAYDLGEQHGGPVYALEGAVAIAGRLVQWIRDNLGLIKDAPEVEEWAKKCDPELGTGGVTLVPAFQGLFAPYWREDTRAVLCGMTLACGKPEICLAALEAVAFQVGDPGRRWRRWRFRWEIQGGVGGGGVSGGGSSYGQQLEAMAFQVGGALHFLNFDSSPAIGICQGDLVDCGDWGSKWSVADALLGGSGRVNEM